MHQRALPLAVSAALVAVLGTALLWAGWRAGPVVEPGIEVMGASPAQEALVTEVLATLGDEGLLADIASQRVEVRFSCDLHPVGLARERRGIWEVEVCREEAWVVAHELAHVYVETNASPEARRILMAKRGLTVWEDPEQARWQDLGAEHAAEIIRWGVTGYGTEIGVSGPDDPPTLARHFEVLTGEEPSWWPESR